MRQVPLPASAIELVAVTTGPGSFTGIRVGIAAARGISLGLGVPLVGVTGFEAALAAIGDTGREASFLLVALESRRADLYVQLFDPARRPLGGPAAVLPEALAEIVGVAGRHPLAITGDAAGRAVAALGAVGLASVVEDAEPTALGALRAAALRWRRGEERGGEPAGPVRPLYLRPPDVTLAAPAPPGRR
jgi:tRNA threonylcarbamoyladenosine biosynthesis protein TsaB